MLRRMGRSGIVPFSVRYLDDFITCYPLGKADIRGKAVVDIGCVPEGHMVLGETKDISQYAPFDRVFSSSGLVEVTKTHKRHYRGILYEIHGRGLLPFTVTAEHPVLTNAIHGARSREKPRKVGDRRWKTAGTLLPRHDALVFPKLKQEIPCKTFPLHYERPPPNRYGRVEIKVDEQMAELLGLYVAEGNSKNVVELSFGAEEHDLVQRATYLIESTLPYKVSLRNRNATTIVRFGGSALSRFLHSNFGDDARTKRIPDWLLQAPRPILGAFLKGVWKGDGYDSDSIHHHSNGVTVERETGFLISSKALALGLQLAFSKFDIFMFLNHIHRAGLVRIQDRIVSQSDAFNVRASTRETGLESVLGTSQSITEGPRHRFFLEDNNNFFLPVTEVNESYRECPVFNLTTTSNDYLLSNVVVHNCEWGSTPICWRANGASKVIGFETNPKSIKWLARLREEPWFEFRGKWTGDYPDADVLKMDCEGCEADLDISKLTRYGLWFVATHRQKPKPGRTQLLDTYGLDQQLIQLGGEKVYEGEWANESERVYRGGFLLK